MAETITLRRPDDWHAHLRDGDTLKAVLPYTAAQFARAIVMPNLVPPAMTASQGRAYRERIEAAIPAGVKFTPLMTAYLTNNTDPDDLDEGFTDGVFTAAKLYPAHATTNSAHGVTDIANIDDVLSRMEKIGMPLLVHGEVTSPEIDIFDREAVFIDKVMIPTLKRHPGLKVVFEHATTQQAVEFVQSAGPNVAATITPHHLILNRNAMFQGGIRPHHYCLPIVKREQHRLALVKAATSGDASFFLGTDTAPHAVHTKENACGCAGIFNAPEALSFYAEVFEREGALDKLEAFASLNGPRFYGLPVNEERVTLARTQVTIPQSVALPGGGEIRPFRAGETLAWKLT